MPTIDNLDIKIKADSTRAIAALESLATKLGTVSNKISTMPRLQLDKNINVSAKTMNASLNKTTRTLRTMNSGLTSTQSRFKGLASYIGKFYASYFLFIRGFGKLWSAIKSSMNYLETVNYFNAAMEQLAGNAVSTFGKAGEDSAKSFIDQYTSSIMSLNSKLTGYNLQGANLIQTGTASLGLNPNETLNAQAQFSQMASSMGVSSEYAVKLSNALTMIGADLASVKNMEFSEVWNNMASGLVGMSRTVDKFGVNIRNVNMQQKLYDLGINTNIANLNQQDKALLRTIIILDSTKYAWGDLSDTINAPANQLRVLTSNIKVAGQLLGSLFLPTVQAVLPYLNGFTMAIQRLIIYIGELMDIDMSAFTKSSGASNSAISDILDDAENATDAVKELKYQLMGFDEINKLSDTSTSDTNASSNYAQLYSAFDESLAEYQKVWDNAFKSMDNNASKIADRIEKALEPVKKIIGDFAIGDFFSAGEDVSKLVTSINKFVTKALRKVDWEKIGTKIGEFLKGINWKEVFLSLLDVINAAVKGFINAWASSFEVAPLETGILTIFGLLKFTKLGTLLKTKLAKALGLGIEEAAKTSSMSAACSKAGLSIAAVAGSAIIGYNLGTALYESITGEDAGTFQEQLDYFLHKVSWKELKTGFLMTLDDMWSGLKSWWEDVWEKAKSLGKGGEGSDIKRGETFIGSQDEKDENGTTAYNIKVDVNEAEVLDAKEQIDKLLNEEPITAEVETDDDKSVKNFNTYKNAVQNLCDEEPITLQVVADTKPANHALGDLKKGNKIIPIDISLSTNNAERLLKTLREKSSTITSKLALKTSDAITTYDTFVKGHKSFSTSLAMNTTSAIKDIDNFKKYAKTPITITTLLKDKNGNDISGSGLANILSSSLRLNQFATGGFPEDGLFYANHNELVGQFSNGKTAVVNNAQIVDGVANGVYNAVVSAMSVSGGNNNQPVIVQIDGKNVFTAVRSEANSYTNRTGLSAFA